MPNEITERFAGFLVFEQTLALAVLLVFEQTLSFATEVLNVKTNRAWMPNKTIVVFAVRVIV
jgi:hypothetical protein